MHEVEKQEEGGGVEQGNYTNCKIIEAAELRRARYLHTYIRS